MSSNSPLYSLYGDSSIVPSSNQLDPLNLGSSGPAPFQPQPSTFDPSNNLVFTPSVGSPISYSSSPLQLAGYTGKSTVDTGLKPASTLSSIGEILSGISNTVLGGIAISRIPSNQIGQVSNLQGRTTVTSTNASILGNSGTTSLIILAVLGVAVYLLIKRG